MPRFPLLLASLIALASALAAPQPSPAQERSFRGIPYFRFFNAKDFDSGASSVFVATSADGTVFYGDRNWIMLYDGAAWRKIYQNSNTTEKIAALHWDEDGTIYAAGFNIFGELVVGPDSRARFHSLVPPERIGISEDYQRIQSVQGQLFLTGRRSFGRYDKQTGSFDSHVFPTWITATYWFDGAMHVVTDSNEVHRYQNQSFTLVPEATRLLQRQKLTIADTVVAQDGSIIMGAERRGLYRFDGQDFAPAYPNFQHDPSHLLRDLELTADNRLILASLGGGVVVLDDTGNVLERFDGSVDHRFKSARSIAIDRSGALWSMFNSTVAKVLLDSSLSAIDERIRPSFFYATQHVHGDTLYARSFYILYRARFDRNNRLSGFENALPDSEFEVWSVAEGSDGLYINTSENGIYRLRDERLVHLADSPAYDRLIEPRLQPNLIVGANADTIALYEKRGETLALLHQRENPRGFINRIQEDAQGHLWFEYGLGAVGRARIQDRQLRFDLYTTDHGLPDQEWLTLWMHDEEALVTYSGGVLRLDEASDAFLEHPILQSPGLDPNLRIERAFTDPQGNLWISANDKNIIFWKQADGSYREDDASLSEMGEPYFEFITFLPDGQALIMTAFEFFHFEPRVNALYRFDAPPPTRIVAISSLNDEQRHYTYLGNETAPAPRSFPYAANSLAFDVANAFTYSTVSPVFQYYLEGFSPEFGPESERNWSSSSSVSFTNLDPGRYTFHARAKLGDGSITPWTAYPFSIEPPFYRTFFAYFIYFCVFVLSILVSIELYSRRLRRQNLRLEQMVASRTQEIEAKNLELERQAETLESKNVELASQSEEIQRNASELAATLNQLHQAQDQLLATARTAGRAEVATNVLHNVGNVLNSVNIGIRSLESKLDDSRAKKLARLAAILNERRDDLAEFLASDPRGQRIPDYLEQLSNSLSHEVAELAQEVALIGRNVDHIKQIIATQQTHAKDVSIIQRVPLDELVHAALAIALGDAYETRFQIERDIPSSLAVQSDKHKLLDVLINLIKNAKEAIDEHGPDRPNLSLRAFEDRERNRIELTITDNGIGFDEGVQPLLFNHGFTTKETGHGFGLHSCAITVKSLGGQLRLTSPGPGKGATATLALPR